MDEFVIFVILIAALYVIWCVLFVSCLENIKHEFDRKTTKKTEQKGGYLNANDQEDQVH